jgi:ribosomal protein S10
MELASLTYNPKTLKKLCEEPIKDPIKLMKTNKDKNTKCKVDFKEKRFNYRLYIRIINIKKPLHRQIEDISAIIKMCIIHCSGKLSSRKNFIMYYFI